MCGQDRHKKDPCGGAKPLVWSKTIGDDQSTVGDVARPVKSKVELGIGLGTLLGRGEAQRCAARKTGKRTGDLVENRRVWKETTEVQFRAAP